MCAEPLRSQIRRATLAVAAIALLAAGACSPRIDANGNRPDPERLAEITPGSHTRNDVAEILGSPSSVTLLDRETWFYISKRTEVVAFFAPEVTDQQVVIIRFDDQGVVEAVDSLGLEDRRDVRLVDRETPTTGNELTVVQQIVGNFGRFSKEGQ